METQRAVLVDDDVIGLSQDVDADAQRLVARKLCPELERLFEVLKQVRFSPEDWEAIERERHEEDENRL